MQDVSLLPYSCQSWNCRFHFQPPSPSDDSQLPPQNGQGAAEGLNINPPPNERKNQNVVIEDFPKEKHQIDSLPEAKPHNDTQIQISKKQQIRKAIVQSLGFNVDENFDFERDCDKKYSKETESALLRASTDQCQKEIMMTACLDMKGMLYPKRLPRFCPLQGKSRLLHILQVVLLNMLVKYMNTGGS